MKQSLESIYSACCVAFMSLWRTCPGDEKLLETRKITIETVKNKTLHYKCNVAVITHAV